MLRDKPFVEGVNAPKFQNAREVWLLHRAIIAALLIGEPLFSLDD